MGPKSSTADGHGYAPSASAAPSDDSPDRFAEAPVYRDLIRRAREHAFENLFDAVVVTDMEGLVVDWNRGSELLYGYTREEILGQPVSILHLPEHREHVLSEVLSAVERDGRWQGEVGLLRKDGSRGWIESSVVPLFDDHGQPVGALGINRDISDRVAAEKELREAETRYRLIVQASTDVFRDWDVATGTVTWGPSTAPAFHYDPARLGGTIDWWTSRIHPDDRSAVVGGLWAVLDSAGDSWSGEYRFRKGDGDYAAILDRARVVRSPSGKPIRVMSSMHDVTKRRRGEEVQAFLARASALLDTSLDGDATLTNLARLSVPFLSDCCLVDVVDGTTGKLRRVAGVHADPACQDRMQKPEPHSPDRRLELARIQAVATGESILVPDLGSDPRFLDDPDQIEEPAPLQELGIRSLIMVPLVARGEVLGVITLGASHEGRPYTPVDLATAENLASRAAQALDNAILYREARAAMQARSRLFADISHEFRTPLMLALGPLDDLLEGRHGETSPIQRQQIGMARRNAARVLELINRILDLARLEAGRLPLHARPLDLSSFVDAFTADFAPLARRRSLDLLVDLPPDPVILHADAEHLGKVLSNLLSNALKFTPAGGMVQVRVETDGDTARLSIRDSGRGIPARELERIFDRFHRAEDEEGLPAGSGIGLALSKELVELHGGTLEVQSEEGLGSTFTAALPLGDIAPATVATPDRTGQDGAGHTTRTSRPSELPADRAVDPGPGDAPDDRTDVPTVLIVEDNEDVRAYLRKHLERRFRVLEAADGREGLETARRTLPDLVLSDLMMPGMDGFALCRAIKQDPETDLIPVVLLTARAAPEDRLSGLELQADDYLTKPFRADELIARAENLIAARRRLRERRDRAPHSLHAESVEVKSADARFLERVRAAIEANLRDETYSVERLASDVAQSRSHLYRRIRDLLGESPSDLIRRLRLERAAQLLAAGAGSVSSIAYSVGFKSVSHFSNRFLDTYGVRPSAFGSRIVPDDGT